MAFTLKGKLDEIITDVGLLDSSVISTYVSTMDAFNAGTVPENVSTIANTMALEATVSTLTNNVNAVSTVVSTEFASVGTKLSTLISTCAAILAK